MPYQQTSELPKAVQEKYPHEAQRRAFMAAFNAMFDKCDKPKDECEMMAMRVGHMAAKKVKTNDQES